MENMMGKRLLAFSLFLASLLSFNVSAQAADSCQPVFDAEKKLVTTPSHSYSTSTSAKGGSTLTGETIMVQGKKYIRANGKWMDPHITTAEVLDQEKENEKNGKSSCQFVRSESVNGESASLYHMQREVSGFKEDSQIWISKTTGLPLREEQDMDMGGEIGKRHNSGRFEYSNVKPPM
ncbi:MAG: hypothetical protein ACRD3B_13070 [Candidatus Sulfotelmatobacter sp.]